MINQRSSRSISLGTGHYLSPVGGGGSEDFGGDHLILGEQRGGSVVFESPKGGGITENFGRIQRGDHSNLLEQCQFESIQHKCAHSAGR